MTANTWYCIAQTSTFDTGCTINVAFDGYDIQFSASVRFGMSAINITRCNIPYDTVFSLRLREGASQWFVDIFCNKEITPNVTIADSPYWAEVNTAAGAGNIILSLNDITSKYNTEQGGGTGGLDIDQLKSYLDDNGYTEAKNFWSKEGDETIRTRHNIVVDKGGAFGRGSETNITFGRLDNWEDWDASTMMFYTLSASLGVNLNERLKYIEQNGSGLNEDDLRQYLTSNNYLQEADITDLRVTVKGLDDILNGNVGGVIDTWNEVVAFLDGYSQSDDLAAILAGMNEDISNRVLATDFDKANDSIKDLLSYFDANGNANNALKLGGQLPSYYAPQSSLDTTNANVTSLTQKLSTIESGVATNKTNIATLTTNLSDLTGRVDVAEETIKIHTDSIAKNVADIATNATNIGKNATAITDVSNRVTKLEGMWEVDANGNLHTTYNIVVDGGGAFGKGSTSGGDVPSASVSIKFEGSNVLYNPINGVITLPAYPSAGGGVADSVAWSNISGKPNFATVATSGKYSDLSGTPTIPTSLKSPYALTFGSKTYDGSSAKTILASDLGALTAHQTIYSLTINNSAGTAQVTYTPNSKAASLTLTKAMVGLGNVDNTADSAKSVKYATTAGSAPASDVYAWAKAATKPSYAFSEITSKPTTLDGYGITNGVSGYKTSEYLTFGFDNVRLVHYGTEGDWRLTNNGWTREYTLLHSNNYTSYTYPKTDIDTKLAGYLPLSGGTISGLLTIKRDRAGVRFLNSSGESLGWLGFLANNTPVIYNSGGTESKYLLHSGNYSSYALPLSGGTMVSGAGIYSPLDSVYAAIAFNSDHNAFGSPNVPTRIRSSSNPVYTNGSVEYSLIHSGNIGSYSMVYDRSADGEYASSTKFNTVGYGNTALDSGWKTYGPILTFGIDAYHAQLQKVYNSDTLYVRSWINGAYTDWKTIAFTDSNVASATKLQTPRTIWGQSFDGSANVSGGLADVTSILFNTANGIGIYRGSVYTGALTATDIAINGGKIVLNPTGNVLIGTTEDSGAKVTITVPSRNSFPSLGSLGSGSDLALQYGTYYGLYFSVNTQNGSAMIQNGRNDGATHTYPILLNPLGGNVLIGTTTDYGYKLDVSGPTRITGELNVGNSSQGVFLLRRPSANYIWASEAGGYLVLGCQDSGSTGVVNSSLVLTSSAVYSGIQATLGLSAYRWGTLYGTSADFSGNVNIGGNLTVTGGGAFGSDIRYKDITSYRQIALETIVNAPLFTFRWTDREDKIEHLGTSAQYWLDTQFKDAVNTANKDFFHLDYGALAVGIGISVAREVKGVKTEVEVLKERVNQLEKELAQYRRA